MELNTNKIMNLGQITVLIIDGKLVIQQLEVTPYLEYDFDIFTTKIKENITNNIDVFTELYNNYIENNRCKNKYTDCNTCNKCEYKEDCKNGF